MKNILFKKDEDLTGLDDLSPKELAQIMKASSLDGAKPAVDLDLDEAREFVAEEIESVAPKKHINFERFFWAAAAYAVAASVALIFFITPKDNSYQVAEDEEYHASCDFATINEWDAQYHDYRFGIDQEDFKYATLTLSEPDGTVIYKMRSSDDHISVDLEGITSDEVIWTMEMMQHNDTSLTINGKINIIRK